MIDAMIMMFGPPNSGKGTYGKRIARRFDIPFIAAGDLVREQLTKDESWFGGRYSWYIYNQGGLVPGDLMGRLIREKIASTGGVCVLDGYPRTREQMVVFEEFGFPYALVHIDQDDETLIKRAMGRMTCEGCGEIYAAGNPKMQPNPDGSCVRCGAKVSVRSDDTEEAVRKRLAKYREETKPILEALKDRAILWMEISPMTDDVDDISDKIGTQIEEMMDVVSTGHGDVVATIRKYRISDERIAKECGWPGGTFVCRSIEELPQDHYLHRWLEAGVIEEVPFDIKGLSDQASLVDGLPLTDRLPAEKYEVIHTMGELALQSEILRFANMMRGEGPSPVFDIHFRISSANHAEAPRVKDDKDEYPLFCFCVRMDALVPDPVGGPLATMRVSREFHQFVWKEPECYCLPENPDVIAKRLSDGLRARGFVIGEINTSLMKRPKVPHGRTY